jgi:hypothetical protein
MKYSGSSGDAENRALARPAVMCSENSDSDVVVMEIGEELMCASLLENWIDEAERSRWFLFEASRPERG